MSGAVVADVLEQLTAVYAAANVPDVEVFDGPAYNPEGSFLAVGWSRSEDAPGVTGNADVGDLSGLRSHQTFEVLVLLCVWLTDDVATARRTLFDAFNAFDAALAANRQLNGVATTARVTAYDLTTVAEGDGGRIDYQFTVTVQTFQ